MKIGLAALAIVAFATSAHANPAENPFAKDEVVLDLRGLDLATAQGQQRLAIRMDQAARAVCGDRVAAVHLAMEAKAQACRTAVVADIRTQIETRSAMAGTPSESSRRIKSGMWVLEGISTMMSRGSTASNGSISLKSTAVSVSDW